MRCTVPTCCSARPVSSPRKTSSLVSLATSCFCASVSCSATANSCSLSRSRFLKAFICLSNSSTAGPPSANLFSSCSISPLTSVTPALRKAIFVAASSNFCCLSSSSVRRAVTSPSRTPILASRSPTSLVFSCLSAFNSLFTATVWSTPADISRSNRSISFWLFSICCWSCLLRSAAASRACVRPSICFASSFLSLCVVATRATSSRIALSNFN